MERAVETTLQALEDAGLLTGAHAARAQLARELAKVVGIGAATAKTSVPLAAAQLNSTLDSLPKIPELPPPDEFTKAMNEAMGS